ncbi:MAG: hypothetical protein Kilf2KO_32100 [Rhodospirillales bacterium]
MPLVARRATLSRIRIGLAGAALLFALQAPAQAQDLDLASLTCGQVGRISPEAVQTTVIGLAVGYAMGERQIAFDLEEANAWFAAFRDLCAQAPQAAVTEVMPLLEDRVAAAREQ